MPTMFGSGDVEDHVRLLSVYHRGLVDQNAPVAMHSLTLTQAVLYPLVELQSAGEARVTIIAIQRALDLNVLADYVLDEDLPISEVARQAVRTYLDALPGFDTEALAAAYNNGKAYAPPDDAFQHFNAARDLAVQALARIPEDFLQQSLH